MDNSYYPQDALYLPQTGKSVYEFGDGLLNIEKYRGFYGIFEGVNIVHNRYHPGKRHITFAPGPYSITDMHLIDTLFNLPNDTLIDTTATPHDTIIIVNARQTEIDFLQTIKDDSVKTTIQLNKFKFTSDSINADSLFTIKRPPRGDSGNSGIYDFALNALLNSYLRNLPNHQFIQAFYNFIVWPYPPSMATYPNVTYVTGKLGTTLKMAKTEYKLDSLGVITDTIEYSFSPVVGTSFTFLEDIYYAGINSTTADTDFVYVNKLLSKVLAHESGHFASMLHPNELPSGIGTTSISIMSQGALIPPPLNYLLRDFYPLLLSEPKQYSPAPKSMMR